MKKFLIWSVVLVVTAIIFVIAENLIGVHPHDLAGHVAYAEGIIAVVIIKITDKLLDQNGN